MSAPLLWFNKALSNTWEILALLRNARQANEFQILCTHPRIRYPGRNYCDIFEQEPDGLGEAEYVRYGLEMVKRHGVNFFWPGRGLLPILRARRQFDEAGVRLLAAADARTVDLLNHKARLYAALANENIPIPVYQIVNDLAGFDAAWKRLRPQHELLCYKPAVGVYGLGFHLVADREPGLTRLKNGDPLCISLEEARRSLRAKGRFRDLMLMQYLEGPERSVDCLAQDGALIRCVVRRKEAGAQVLEENAALAKMVRGLTARFRLNNVFNVQFRDAGGRSYLLEINPRMAGGLPFACHSGLILPYWAIRLALGTAMPEDVPEPQTGLRIPQPEPVSSL